MLVKTQKNDWTYANYKLHPDYLDSNALGLSITIIEGNNRWKEIRRGILESYSDTEFVVKPIEGKKKSLKAKFGTEGFVFSPIDVDRKVVIEQ